ncbi:MAG: MotA/TolQ/ExbB proton channel family protein [Deltaproteobacteria bacterium]|jgi:biopolymer transport protein TolQ|nr:MotA/TolQ/ExbB proton channel family protein [Deltaproteobacteria bacterium]
MNSFVHAVIEATLVSQLVLLLLTGMSVASWAFMLSKWSLLRAARKSAVRSINELGLANDLASFLNILRKDPQSPFFGVARWGIREFNRICKTGDAAALLNDNVRRALHFGIAEQMAALKSSLPLLATTSNTAPFIGLFGTVWGIMHAFQAIASLKSVSLATVAPGIAEALIATAMGLFVAIPATLGYNVCKARLAVIESECVNFAGMLLNRLQHEVDSYQDCIGFADIRPEMFEAPGRAGKTDRG